MSDDNDKAKIVRTVASYKEEADAARTERLRRNDLNFDFYHLKQDYSHKKTGQSQEFLAKQNLAVEQITSFVHQGLVDFGDWFSVESRPGIRNPLVTDNEARLILSYQLERAGFYTFVQDAIKSGLLGSLMIAKVRGIKANKPEYFTTKTRKFLGFEEQLKRRSKRVWRLQIDLVRQKDYYPDPTGDGLYELQDIEMDYWQLVRMAKEDPDTYDMEEIELLRAHLEAEEREFEKNRETGQTDSNANYRRRVILTECWGTLLDEQGEVMFERGVCAIANDQFLVRPPKPDPFWHGESPFVVAPVVRVPHSVHHRALMDAPTSLNQALNELFNLLLDSGIMSVFGVRQVREGWIDNIEDISNGIAPGQILKANSSCPPGAQVIETVSTAQMSAEAVSIFQLMNSEFQASALTNDLRLGVLPSRAVKATEVVEASQSITSVFTGVAKAIENSFIEPILEKAWLTIMQHADDLDSDEMVSLLGEERARQLAAVSPSKRFEQTVAGHDFTVFGITQTLNKIRDFRKLTTMLQTIGSSAVLMEEFSRKYDPSKLLTEMLKSLDINTDKIALEQTDEVLAELQRGGRPGEVPGRGPPGPGEVPAANEQSQVTQMGGGSPGMGPESSGSAVPRTSFPFSQGAG